MTAPRPHDRLISDHTTAEEALETFTVRLPEWPVLALFRRNPLLRASDRIQALVLAVAVVVSLVTFPVAAAIGTAVYDSRRDIYAQQHQTRHLVSATITDDAAAQDISQTETATMMARWTAAGSENTGAVEAQPASKPGNHVTIWVDDSGALTDEPTPTSRAGVDAVTAALFMWAGVTAAMALLVAVVQVVCDRVRAIRWQRALDTLIGGSGRKPSEP